MAYTNLTESALYTRLRQLMNQTTEVVTSDADLLTFIDEATIAISGAGALFEEEGTTKQLTAGTFEYAIGSGAAINVTDLMSIEGVLFYGTSATAPGISAKALQKIHPRQIDHLQSNAQGEPKYWYLQNATLGLWPIPDSSSDYIKILYYKQTYDYNDGANVPDYLQEYVIWYALAKHFEKNGMFAQAQQYMSYFNTFVGFASIDRHNRNIDSINMMTQPDRTKYV